MRRRGDNNKMDGSAVSGFTKSGVIGLIWEKGGGHWYYYLPEKRQMSLSCPIVLGTMRIDRERRKKRQKERWEQQQNRQFRCCVILDERLLLLPVWNF